MNCKECQDKTDDGRCLYFCGCPYEIIGGEIGESNESWGAPNQKEDRSEEESGR